MSSPAPHSPGADLAVPVRDRLEAARIVAVVRVPALRPLMDRVDVLPGAGEEAITILGLPAPRGWSPDRALSTDQRVALLERPRDDPGLRAAAAAYLKQSVTGDINIASVPEIEDARSSRGTDRLRC